MQIDNYAFETTAKAVYVMNDSAREKYDSWEELRDFMVDVANSYGNDLTTSLSTGGFQLSFYKSSEESNEKFVTASVQGFTALKYAEKMLLTLIDNRVKI